MAAKTTFAKLLSVKLMPIIGLEVAILQILYPLALLCLYVTRNKLPRLESFWHRLSVRAANIIAVLFGVLLLARAVAGMLLPHPSKSSFIAKLFLLGPKHSGLALILLLL